jgi:hypothetical protein
MYKRFVFEGEVHQLLDCVPLTVRRKLDLAALKISLEGWQALSRSERQALCHLPVETAEEISVYREVLEGFCAKAKVPLKPLVDPDAEARAWNIPSVPERVKGRAQALQARLDDRVWASLDEESRYALLKLSDPKRNPEKLKAALIELGLLDGEPAALTPEVAVCVPSTSTSPSVSSSVTPVNSSKPLERR